MTGTRQRLIEATATLFATRGYDGTGLKQVSTDSAAPLGSLYHFFPGGKKDLAAEALRWSGAGYQLLVEAILDSAPDIVSGVRNCFDGAAETLRLSDYADACPIATVALEVASRDDDLRRVTEEVFDGWLDSVAARLIDAGIERVRAREVATVLVAAIEGGFLLSRAARDTTAMEVIGRSMVDLVRRELPPASEPVR